MSLIQNSVISYLISNILSELKGEKFHLLGDYNNLLELDDTYKDQFEEMIFTNGFTPLISTATHKQPQSSKTCIDNIYTNDIDSSIISGVISDNISHHNPIFHLKQMYPSQPTTTTSSNLCPNPKRSLFTMTIIVTLTLINCVKKSKKIFSSSSSTVIILNHL